MAVIANGLRTFPGASASITVSAADVHQTIEGFGASDAFHSPEDAAPLTSGQLDMFFDPTLGIGLSFLRSQFLSDGTLSTGSYSNMLGATARGAKCWVAPWSAPAAYKDNGSETGGGHLLVGHYTDWANVFASVFTAAKAAGVNLYAMSIQNEPDFVASYVSMVYTNAEMTAFIKVLGPILAALSPTPIILLPETSNWDNASGYATSVLGDGTAAPYLGRIATHQYGGTVADLTGTRKVWETEMSSFDGFDPTITHGLTVAGWIHSALTTGQVSAWHYFWLCGENADNEGLIGQLFDFEITKRFYVMGNYSKFIRPGYVRVGIVRSVSGVLISAYVNQSTGAFVVVCVNTNSSSTDFYVQLSGLFSTNVTPWVTSALLNLSQEAQAPVKSGVFQASLPALSVTSYVGTGS